MPGTSEGSKKVVQIMKLRKGGDWYEINGRKGGKASGAARRRAAEEGKKDEQSARN